MKRNLFIKSILGTTLFISMDGISTIANALSISKQEGEVNSNEMASFGAVHLKNTSIQKSIPFWTNVIGLKLRFQSDEIAEFGTDVQTLVVVHQAAQNSFKEGYSGLYHFAIHLPNKSELAKAIFRLQNSSVSYSPIDHTMSQSLYLTDSDNVMVELTLETPERYKRVITEGGLFIEDVNGNIRGASAPLDTEEILKSLVDRDLSKIVSNDTRIGHIHFYAKDVASNNDFYKKLGFSEFNYFPQYKYADLGAGGAYKHRIALNSWHGKDKPLAPSSNAGLMHYQIKFKSKEHLQNALKNIGNVEEKEGAYWTSDPTGIRIMLSQQV
jgi:catechol 2,3-dioxygenase